MPTSRLSALLWVGIILLSQPLHADQIILANGDQITGKVVTKKDGTLVFQTQYAGKLKVSWKDVVKLRTDEPVDVMLQDDTNLHAVVSSAEEGKVKLKAGKIIETAPIPLDKIAYINPPPEISGKGVKFTGRVNLGINATSGNTQTKQLHLDTEMVARTRFNRYTVGAIANRASDSGTTITSNATAYTKYDHFLSKKRYFYINARFHNDKFKDLNLRTTLGVGLGHQFWESEQRNLYLEGGVAYVNEDFIDAQDDHYGALRWGVRYDQWLFNHVTQFFHQNEGTIGLSQGNDVVINSQTGFRFPLGDGFNTSVQVNADWERHPAPGKKNTDLTYLLNLGYAW